MAIVTNRSRLRSNTDMRSCPGGSPISPLHLLDRLDAEQVQALLQNSRRELAENQPRRSRWFVRLQHGASLVKGTELTRQIVEIVAEEVRFVIVQNLLQRPVEVEKLFCQIQFGCVLQ